MRRYLLSLILLLSNRSFAQSQNNEARFFSGLNDPRGQQVFDRHESHFSKQTLIFEVRKSIPLSSTERVARDYYINGGTKKGIRKGNVIKVYRKTAVYDPFYNRLSQDLKIEVAELKIIHAEHNVSIGRIFNVGENADKVALDFQAPMVGDSLDVSSAYFPAGINSGGSNATGQGLGDLKYLDASYDARQVSFQQDLEQIKTDTTPKQPEPAAVQTTDLPKSAAAHVDLTKSDVAQELAKGEPAKDTTPKEELAKDDPSKNVPLKGPIGKSLSSRPKRGLKPTETVETVPLVAGSALPIESSVPVTPSENLQTELPEKSAIKVEAGAQEKPSKLEEVAVQVQ